MTQSKYRTTVISQAHIDIMAPAIDNPYVASGSSADIDDTSATTNLYIGNLPLTVSEKR